MKSNLGSFARWFPLKQAIRDRNPSAIMMLSLKGPLLYNPQFYPEALHETIVQFNSQEDMWILNILGDYKADINGPAYYSYESREREEWDRNYAHFRKLILYPVDLAYPKITMPLYWAVNHKNMQALRLILRYSPDIDSKLSSYGGTALGLAKRYNMKEYVDILREYGAKDTTWRNEHK